MKKILLLIELALFTCILNAQIAAYKEKKMLPEIYSLWDLSPTAGICLTVSDMGKNNRVDENTELKAFRHHLMTDNVRVLDKIVEQTERSAP